MDEIGNELLTTAIEEAIPEDKREPLRKFINGKLDELKEGVYLIVYKTQGRTLFTLTDEGSTSITIRDHEKVKESTHDITYIIDILRSI